MDTGALRDHFDQRLWTSLSASYTLTIVGFLESVAVSQECGFHKGGSSARLGR